MRRGDCVKLIREFQPHHLREGMDERSARLFESALIRGVNRLLHLPRNGRYENPTHLPDDVLVNEARHAPPGWLDGAIERAYAILRDELERNGVSGSEGKWV